MTELDLLRFQKHHAGTLKKVRDADKALRVSVRAVREFFGADFACLAVLEPAETPARLMFEIPPRSGWDREMLGAFVRLEHPSVPRDCILAPLRRKRRVQAAIGLRLAEGEFERGAGERLCDVAATIAECLEEIDRNRARDVRDRIDRKIMEEIRPKDLFYQILHGLRSLTHYDHSSALLIARDDRSTLELVAEQIAWRKGKSRRIGRRLALTDDHRRHLSADLVYGFDRDGDVWREWSGRPAEGLARLLDYDTGPEDVREAALLCAPLATRDGFLGVIKVAAQHPGTLGSYEAELVERFLSQASVAIQTSRRHETLRARILDAEKRNAVAHLARGVSHDVNNALGAVLPLVQQMRADVRENRVDPEILARDLEQIEESLRICRRIFSGMLGFARGSARQVGQGDVRRAIAGTLAILGDSLERRGIERRVDVADGLPAVRARQGDLEQLLLNLATNARDAMKRGGTLSLRARRRDDSVEIVIADTGPGIAPELLPRIQEPFFTTKDGGSGLGLSICSSIVADMQGRMEIASEPERGTEVRLTLPAIDT